MRRMILTLLLALAASTADAGTMYYRIGNSKSIYAVPDGGGTPQLVVADSEIPWNVALDHMTRDNHVGSNGQAIFAKDTSAAYLIYRANNGVVVIKTVAALGSDPVYTVGINSPELAQDDSFFSFRAGFFDESGVYWNSNWKLNVTVDDVLSPDYVPPTTFDDPRFQLVLIRSDSGDPNLRVNRNHTWSPDGTQMAYFDRRRAVDGTYYEGIRVKELSVGDVETNHDVWLYQVPVVECNWTYDLQWSPVSNQVTYVDLDGNLASLDADAPGSRTWIARATQTKAKTQSITEKIKFDHRWRPDGEFIGVSYERTTQTRKNTKTEYFPAVLTPSGWPATMLQSTPTTDRVKILGWVP